MFHKNAFPAFGAFRKEKQYVLQLFLIVFFNESQDAVEEHGNDAKDHNGHENPGKLEAVTAHSDRKKSAETLWQQEKLCGSLEGKT